MTNTKKLIGAHRQSVDHQYSIIMNSAMAEICSRHNNKRRMKEISIFDKLTGIPVFRQCHSSRLETTLSCMADEHIIAHDVSNWIEIKDGRGKSYFEGTSHAAFTKYINEYKSKKCK
jgi:hypothetical protein